MRDCIPSNCYHLLDRVIHNVPFWMHVASFLDYNGLSQQVVKKKRASWNNQYICEEIQK